MKVLVTGGAGYIGSVVVDALHAADHEVAVLDNLSKGHRDVLSPEVSLHVVDLLDADAVHRVLRGGFDAVLHFAASSIVGESVDEPVRYFRTNVGGTLNLLDAMRSNGVRRLVFSSTAAVYGEPVATPIVETDPTIPTNPYGASKLAVDEMIRFEAAASGLAAVSLRYFNVAGASGRCGERHDPETHLIPSCWEPHWVGARSSTCTARTTTRRTVRRCATTSTSRISHAPTCSRSTPPRCPDTASTTSGTAPDTP
jgi:UDP-glucose 4-epimerase